MDNKVDLNKFMNDQMKAVLVKSQEIAGDAFDTNAGFEEMRANYVKERAYWNEEPPAMAKVSDEFLEGPMGEFKVRYYYPVEADKLPVIVYVHGGGFVVGSVDTHDRVCRLLATHAGAAVVSVDYHLSPESVYPTNIQEVVAVAKYLHEHGDEKGIDGNDLSFAGDSGGAVLSFAANLWLRDEEGDNSFVKTMLLYYGFYGLTDSKSRRLYGWLEDGMREEDLLYYNKIWLFGEKEGTDAELREKMAAPYVDMLHNDLKTSMPAVFLSAAELDPLRDDSECMYEALNANGVPCEYKLYDGVLHAFVIYTRMLDAANQCIEDSAEFWKKHHA